MVTVTVTVIPGKEVGAHVITPPDVQKHCKELISVIGSFKVGHYWLLIFLLIGHLSAFYCQISNK
jgi:hypothetical protein